eukprot:528811_1
MDSVYFNVGDQVEYNTDPDDDEEAAHVHIGRIVKIRKHWNEISIKLTEDDQIYTYFIDEITIINHTHIVNTKQVHKFDLSSFKNEDFTNQNQFKLSVGIDFGSDGTTLTYALPTGDVFIHNKWKSKKYGSITKQPTKILLNDDGYCVAFGIDASDVYRQLHPKTQGKWLLFDKFKMALCEILDDVNGSKKHADNDGLKIELILRAMNGKKYPAGKVFAEAFKYIKSEAQKYFRKLKLSKIKNHEIQWIMTVPATWNDYAKNQMFKWAIEANLISCDIHNQLKFVLESSCSALAIQHQIKSAKSKEKSSDEKEAHFAEYAFGKGQKYILIHTGDRTVNIAVHEIL